MFFYFGEGRDEDNSNETERFFGQVWHVVVAAVKLPSVRALSYNLVNLSAFKGSEGFVRLTTFRPFLYIFASVGSGPVGSRAFFNCRVARAGPLRLAAWGYLFFIFYF